jgi:hypothetical protein
MFKQFIDSVTSFFTSFLLLWMYLEEAKRSDDSGDGGNDAT